MFHMLELEVQFFTKQGYQHSKFKNWNTPYQPNN